VVTDAATPTASVGTGAGIAAMVGLAVAGAGLTATAELAEAGGVARVGLGGAPLVGDAAAGLQVAESGHSGRGSAMARGAGGAGGMGMDGEGGDAGGEA